MSINAQKVVSIALYTYLAISPFVIGLCAYKWVEFKNKYTTVKIEQAFEVFDKDIDKSLSEN